MDSNKIIDSIRSGVSGVHIQGQDFFRIDEEIEAVATQLNFKIKEWNLGYGWVDSKTKRALKPNQDVSLYDDLKSIADDDPTQRMYIIKNAYSALNNDPKAVARLQQELLRIKCYFSGKAAILLIAKETLPFSEIADLLVTVQCPPLSSNQAEQIFNKFLEEKSIAISTADKSNLISIFSGMERDLVFRIFKELSNNYGVSFAKEAVDDALRLKKSALAQSGLLELVDSTINIDQIGGLEQLKGWLRNKKHIINNLSAAQLIGISVPKGVLLAGMPGCGKSMSAKAAASLFNVPLLRLDIGSLMGKFVGESEANMKAALHVAEKASPCVLWIDELEKAFSGVNGSGGSTEITTRLFGYFLTWMQEKPGAVFVIATANDITTIPPELLRRGRFDEIFYIDLPSQGERKQILKVKTRFIKPAPEGLDFEELSDKSDGFSGADIESAINDSLEYLFRNGKSVLTQDVLEKHIGLITPISVVLTSKIEGYREKFAEYKLKAASLSEEEIDSIDSQSSSFDYSERENAAASEFISSEKLIDLIKDDNAAVRLAALKNPKCSVEGLKYIIKKYKSFDFSKPGLWGEAQVEKEEFDLALQHPNMSGEIILDLYARKVIDDQKLLSLAHKLSSEERKKTFNTANVNLSRSTASATVQKIRCLPDGIVKDKDILIEIDNEKGSTQKVTASVNGIVAKVCVKIGETINAGGQIAQILVLKNQGSVN